MLQILITGFEPFGNSSENSSWAVAERVAARGVNGVEVVAELLPVSFSRVAGALRSVMERHNPDIVIMLGQSSKSSAIKLERVALNMMDSAMGDNDGYKPNEEVIYEGESGALFTSLPIKRLCSTMAGQGAEVKISNSAGLYVCNRLFYEALRMCKSDPSLKALFIHLPCFKGQKGMPNNENAVHIDTMVNVTTSMIEILTQIR